MLASSLHIEFTNTMIHTCTYILGHLDGGMQALLCRTVPSGQKHPAEQRVKQMIAE